MTPPRPQGSESNAIANFYKSEARAPVAPIAHSPIYAVIHFAGLKAVGESVAQPLRYYENNLKSTFNLLRVCSRPGLPRLLSPPAHVLGVHP